MAQNDTSKTAKYQIIPFSIEQAIAAIDISAICCEVLAPFSIENGISDAIFNRKR